MTQFDRILPVLVAYAREGDRYKGIRPLVVMGLDRGYAEEDYSALFDIINPGEP